MSTSQFLIFPLQCIYLRSELSLTRAKVRESGTREEELLSTLVKAEERAARLESPTVAALGARSASKQLVPDEEEHAAEPEPARSESPPVSCSFGHMPRKQLTV